MKALLSAILCALLGLSTLLMVGCGSGEPEIDPNVPVMTEKDLKPGDPRPSGVGAAGGGAPAGGGGAPQTPSTE